MSWRSRWATWLGAMVLAAACGPQLPKAPEPPWTGAGVHTMSADGWTVTQLRESSVVAGCKLQDSSTLVDSWMDDGFPSDLDPELLSALEEEDRDPALGAFCAYRASEGCCYEAGARDLSVLLSSRVVTSLDIGLRSYPEQDVLESLAEHPELVRSLRELTILLDTGGGGRPAPVDLAPLLELPALQRLTIAGVGTVLGLEPLLGHPTLTELDVGWLKLSKPDITRLRAQDRVQVRWDPMKSYRRHNGPACAQPAHDAIRATTETAPEGYHFNCEWPFPE